MKQKVLFVATVDSHIELFHLPYLKMFKDRGYEVHVATNSDKKIKYCDKKIKLPIKRNPFRFSNLKAIFALRKILKTEKYDIIHCHTPMGGVVARLAAKKARKNGTRVIYTAHGFHFYEGAPMLNWILYYPVEKWLSKYTDTLITINVEDFERAKAKFKKRCLDIQYMPGVGVDAKKFEKKLSEKQKKELRKSLGLSSDDKVLICVGRLDKNKNQGFLIKAMRELLWVDDRYHLLLVGPDENNGKYQKIADRFGVSEYVHFLGFRDDIAKLLQISDVVLSASKREGLPVNLIEAAMLGLPIVATDCRGNRDVCEFVGGKLVSPGDTLEFVKYVERGKNSNRKCDVLEYSTVRILENAEKIYKLNEDHKLSVIIPVYNCEKYINECVNSILRQDDNKKTEIIIIDDGSTDGSRDICDDLAKKNANVKAFHYKNHGVSVARNFGLKKSTGDYVYFVDADDVLLSGCIKTIYKAFEYAPDVISVGCGKNIVFKNKNERIFPIFLNTEMIDLNSRCQLHCNIIRKEILKDNNLQLDSRLKYTEDMDLTLEVLLLSKKVAFVKKPLYGYRKNDSSATSYINKKRIADLVYFLDKWQRKINDIDNIKFRKRLEDFLAYQLLILMGMVNVCGDDDPIMDEYFVQNVDILKWHKTMKVRFGYLCYKMFGVKKTIAAMGKYLSSKGVVREIENV